MVDAKGPLHIVGDLAQPGLVHPQDGDFLQGLVLYLRPQHQVHLLQHLPQAVPDSGGVLAVGQGLGLQDGRLQAVQLAPEGNAGAALFHQEVAPQVGHRLRLLPPQPQAGGGVQVGSVPPVRDRGAAHTAAHPSLGENDQLDIPLFQPGAGGFGDEGPLLHLVLTGAGGGGMAPEVVFSEYKPHGLLQGGEYVLHIAVGAGNDVDAHQLPHLGGSGGTGVGGGFDGPHIPPDHDGYQAPAHMDLANKAYVCGLHHGVRRFDGAHQALGLHHAQSCIGNCMSLFTLLCMWKCFRIFRLRKETKIWL